ncbi:S9 family peptidase [Candidatus Bathyarchaeota archaeon]|nr:S9 family peptidase [Candidatus Bathyarchaeota archaeon]
MAKRNIKVEDLRAFKFVSDPQISPDGSRIAFVYSEIDHEEDKYQRHIWFAETSTGKLTQFTYGPGADTYPRWSPDGKKLLFLSNGRQPDKKTQLYVINLGGGEAQLVADTENGVSSPAWSPDGKSLLFTSKVWTEEKPESDVKRITRIRYKFNNVGFFEGRRTHLFTVKPGAKPKQLTKGEYDVNNPKWSQDGKGITFITNMEPDQDTSKVNDIYRIPAKGGDPEKLTDSKYNISNHSHSPDGEYIAYVGTDRPEELAVDLDLFKMKIGGKPKCLTDGFNRSLGMGMGSDLRVASPDDGPVWSSDGKYIYFSTSDTPYCNLYRINTSSKKLETLVTGKSVDGVSVSDNGLIAYNAMNSLEPCELYLYDGAEKKLSDFNKKLLDKLTLSAPEHFTFQNRLGRTVDGWIMKPTGWKKGEKYPCVLEMHGGPRGIYGEGIFQEFQLLAAEGWVVIYTNPRGSAGYEEEYTQEVMRHYGEVDYDDFMDFTDEAIKQYPWIDENRLGLTGGSYGGYTTNWIIGHTDRFKAAVTCRSIANWLSKFGVSDIGFMQPESISGAKTYWGDDLLEQMKRSPIYYVDRVKTPCLLIHSEQDYRCPMPEGEQWFTALKLNNVPTELIRFPDENHELSRSGKPKHREERFQHILRWFREYL